MNLPDFDKAMEQQEDRTQQVKNAQKYLASLFSGSKLKNSFYLFEFKIYLYNRIYNINIILLYYKYD